METAEVEVIAVEVESAEDDKIDWNEVAEEVRVEVARLDGDIATRRQELVHLIRHRNNGIVAIGYAERMAREEAEQQATT